MDGLALIATNVNGHLVQNQLQQHSPNDYAESPDTAGGGSKRKSSDGAQGQQKAKRSRYITLACNECKRRKIKCNGQTPCQRCGNLNLECIYAPNCCSGFKDSQEYRQMTAHIASLQEQVNMLYENLTNLRATLGHPAPDMQQQQQQPQQYSGQAHNGTPIDPNLQVQGYIPHPDSHGGPQSGYGAHMAPMSPSQARQRSHSQQQQQQQHMEQQTFRGPTSTDFSFGVAKNSLQTMGINPQADHGLDSHGDPGSGMGTESSAESPAQHGRSSMQIMQRMHEDKDPIWTISKKEVLRLCRVYEDEMGLMYPLLDIEQVMDYTQRLYGFMDAMRRTGLMQQGFPGADAIDDDDTNILKLVIACALTMEGSGRSQLGAKIFLYVQPAIESLLGSPSVKGIRLLVMTAMYQFHCDYEGTSWRLIGIAARLCIELGLHRHETYDAMPDNAERSSTLLLFWSVYVLDRRWSFGTGMPFAIQDTDIDPHMPRPEDRSPYITAMIKYCEIGSKVWRNVNAAPSPGNGSAMPINVGELDYLDYQVQQWHRDLPASLMLEHPSHPSRRSSPIGPPPSRAGHRLRILLYLRQNQMRILIFRPVLHSATSIMQHPKQAQTVVDVAKDTIRVLTHINQTSDLYRTQQVLFNAFLTSALAVLFLAVSHTPAVFAENVREEFYKALNLVRGFSKGSFVSQRLWKTIRGLKEVGPKLGLDTATTANQIENKHKPSAIQHHRPSSSLQAETTQPRGDDSDPSRSAAVAMAGLAGHDIETLQRGFGFGGQSGWNPGVGMAASSSPDGMADDLSGLFEAAGGLQAMGQQGNGSISGQFAVAGSVGEGLAAGFGGEEGLNGILKELF